MIYLRYVILTFLIFAFDRHFRVQQDLLTGTTTQSRKLILDKGNGLLSVLVRRPLGRARWQRR